MKVSIFKNQKGAIEVYIVGLALLMGLILVGVLVPFNKSTAPPPNGTIQMVDTKDNAQGKNLQLKQPFPIITTSTPTIQPHPACGIANPSILETETNNGACCVYDGAATSANGCCPDAPGTNGGIAISANNFQYWCDAKPVIYLYPQKDMMVSVKLTIPGIVTKSIPTYPNETGWQNILAHPDGSFEYQGNVYHELFYETRESKVTPPKTGFIVAHNNLKSVLSTLTTKLGLLPTEQQEFLFYWLPRLKTPYVFVSVFSPEEKDFLDHVDIEPSPDVFINFILYFKGVDKPFPVKPVLLPQTPPQRNGFTAVEWGGIVDK